MIEFFVNGPTLVMFLGPQVKLAWIILYKKRNRGEKENLPFKRRPTFHMLGLTYPKNDIRKTFTSRYVNYIERTASFSLDLFRKKLTTARLEVQGKYI